MRATVASARAPGVDLRPYQLTALDAVAQTAVRGLRRRRADLERATEGPFDRFRSLQLDGILVVLATLESLVRRPGS